MASVTSMTNPIDLSHALLATGFSYSRETRREQGAKFAKLIPEVRDIRRFGAAAVDLCFVAQGAVSLKWPNDVLLNGAKVAGILLEASSTGAGECTRM